MTEKLLSWWGGGKGGEREMYILQEESQEMQPIYFSHKSA